MEEVQTTFNEDFDELFEDAIIENGDDADEEENN